LTVLLADIMAEMAMGKKHWKEQKFNDNFQAETGGRGISKFEYGGCIGTWRSDNTEADVHKPEMGYWAYKCSEYGLETPTLVHEFTCSTQIFYNYVVFHPETKQVVIVGSECIQRWDEDGNLLKSYKAFERAYSGKS